MLITPYHALLLIDDDDHSFTVGKIVAIVPSSGVGFLCVCVSASVCLSVGLCARLCGWFNYNLRANSGRNVSMFGCCVCVCLRVRAWRRQLNKNIFSDVGFRMNASLYLCGVWRFAMRGSHHPEICSKQNPLMWMPSRPVCMQKLWHMRNRKAVAHERNSANPLCSRHHAQNTAMPIN